MIGWIAHRLMAVCNGADPSPLEIYVPPVVGCWERDIFLSSRQMSLPQTVLVSHCSIHIEVIGYLFYGFSEENSVLSKAGCPFKYK